ncbi:hypothetical protein M0657_003269 [Pyricularia oryzae]|nr:hypothetical protein M9X92_005933 [Pyricularia oryzae]KAI7927447.1 hypothetical protein M0657_003269 [Pyricularia oryzae]
MEEESFQFNLPPELLEIVVQFAIPTRSFKRAMRLRLVDRNFRHIVEKYMFRTRLLDEQLSIIGDDLTHHPEHHHLYRAGAVDTPWFSFMKQYYAQRVLYHPNLVDQTSPDNLLLKTATCLAERKGVNPREDKDAMLSIMTTVCQVGFWENFACLRGRSYGIFNYKVFVGSETAPNNQYLTNLAFANLLLNVVLYLGDLDLIAQVWRMALRYPNLNWGSSRDGHLFVGHEMIAATYGGMNAFKLFNYLYTGIYKKEQYARLFSNTGIMRLVVSISKQAGNARIIHFLLNLEKPWDPSGSWFGLPLKGALLNAHTPDVFEHLAPLAGPQFTPQSPYHRNGQFVSRSTPIGARLAHHAARNNMVMVQHLVGRSSQSFLNCPEPATMLDQPVISSRRSIVPPNYKVANLLVKQQPLYKAVKAGNIELVDYMLQAGADCNISRTSPETALSVAVRRCNLKMVRMLIEKGGADPNRGTPPPIVLAFQSEYLAMIHLLLEKGAILDTTKSGGWAMTIANEGGLDSMKKLLIDLGVKDSPTHVSPYANSSVDFELESVRELMRPGPRPLL